MSDAVLSISSRVGTGDVGNSLIEAAFLTTPGAPGIHTIDTVSWNAPGNHPRRTGAELDPGVLTTLIASYLDREGPAPFAVTTVLTGYLRTRGQAAAALASLSGFDQLIVDPVAGDNGRLYIPPETMPLVRDGLVPRARIVLPNETEAAWLALGTATGDRTAVLAELGQQARRRGQWIVCKSSSNEGGKVRLMILTPEGDQIPVEAQWHAASANGTGDLFSGLIAARLGRFTRWATADVEAAVRYAALRVSKALSVYTSGQAESLRGALLMLPRNG